MPGPPPAGDARVPRRTRPARVLVVDDHRVFAGALGARLQDEADYEVVGIAHTSTQALTLLRATRPDLVLLDYRLGEGTCLDVLGEVDSGGRAVAVVVSGVVDIPDVVAGLAAGARAWVRKDASYAELLDAMAQALSEDGVWISAPLVGPLMRELLDRVEPRRRPRTFLDDLTVRQREVLDLLLHGSTRAEVAARLVLSPNTVRTHIQDLLRRSGSSSTLELLAKARAAGAR
ncbi:response regulator transcription factor [Nocardioides sp.]|uniref:response regulator transcription factor n=1 Tax=Nocardioides sp. TaxID=35761 RepID=UPI001A1B78C2|nr:response regulator transcription factor [Nocardioides sp.]MBJ7357220.1 response regulator transcription factor [Nocardioides sp.]